MKSSQLIGGLLSAAAVLSMASCSCSGNNELGDVNDSPADSTEVLVDGERVSDMIQNISSPVEMANEIKNSGVAFDQGTLNKPGKESQYETRFQRAVNLGVYSADLGYINTFGKNLVVIDYLSSIKRLADGIQVGQFLDFALLSRMAKDNTNLDSLKQLSVSSFNNIDKYLRENKQGHLSTAIVVGTWVEGLYLTGSVIKATNNKGLVDRLAEQKNIVDILQIVVNAYSRANKEYRQLNAQFDELKKIYSQVTITTEMGEPTMEEKDGMLVIVQNEITHVDITPEQTDAIIAKIGEMRQSLVLAD